MRIAIVTDACLRSGTVDWQGQVRQHALRYSVEYAAARLFKHLYPARTIENGMAVSSSITWLP